jgi:hypothetical protein
MAHGWETKREKILHTQGEKEKATTMGDEIESYGFRSMTPFSDRWLGVRTNDRNLDQWKYGWFDIFWGS